MKTQVLISNNNRESLRQLTHTLEDYGMPPEAKIIYRGRNVIGVAGDVCIKSYKTPGLLKRLIYSFFRHPKAERAYFAAVHLLDLGIDTPMPRALVVVKEKGLLTRSYYVCDYYSGWSNLRGVEKRRDFPELAAALAVFMKKIHSHGVLLKDFSVGNILFRKNDDDIFDFSVVDINRIRFGITDRNRLLSAFGKVLDTRQGMEVLAREYAKGTPYVPEELVGIYDRTQAAILRNRRLKNIFRHSKK